jgi:hypothetical protein
LVPRCFASEWRVPALPGIAGVPVVGSDKDPGLQRAGRHEEVV